MEASPVRTTGARLAPGPALMLELQTAYDDLRRCIAELTDVLDLPEPNRARLTSVRLKIATLRLARGPLVGKIAACLDRKTDSSETELLRRLRTEHDELLRKAAAHTSKWSLEAVDLDWPGYRAATRQLLRCWIEKMNWEQEVIYPLLKRCG